MNRTRGIPWGHQVEGSISAVRERRAVRRDAGGTDDRRRLRRCRTVAKCMDGRNFIVVHRCFAWVTRTRGL